MANTVKDMVAQVAAEMKAINLLPRDDFNRAARLNNIARRQEDLYEVSGNIKDLSTAIEIRLRALEESDTSDRRLDTYLENLGAAFYNRHQATRGLKSCKDLNSAIYYQENAVSEKRRLEVGILAKRLNDLNNSFRIRYIFLNNGILGNGILAKAPGDLERAITVGEDAIRLTPLKCDDRAKYLHDLAITLDLSTQRGDLDRAIICGIDAVEASATGSRSRAEYLTNLSTRLVKRYKHPEDYNNFNGDKALEAALEHQREALETKSLKDPERSMMENNMAIAYSLRYMVKKSPDDLRRAIEHGIEAWNICPPQKKASYLRTLVTLLGYQYELDGKYSDLEWAVNRGSDVIKHLARKDPQRARIRNSQLILLVAKHERDRIIDHLQIATRDDNTNSYNVLRAAMEALEREVELEGLTDRERAMMISNLGIAWWSRYQFSRDPEELDEAVIKGEQAIEMTKTNCAELIKYELNLGVWKGARYDASVIKNAEDQEEAIDSGRNALKLLPTGSSDLAGAYINLANRLSKHPGHQNSVSDDLDEAIELYKRAADQPTARPLQKIIAGWSAANLESRPEEEFALLKTAVSLMPRVSPRPLSLKDQQHFLRELYGLSSAAASAALRAGKSEAEALCLLESGNCLIASLAINAHDDVSELKLSAHRNLWEKYVACRRQLSSDNTGGLENEATDYLFRSLQQQKALKRLVAVENEIRGVPGFEHFQRPYLPHDLMRIARHAGGPIVAFNVSNSHSHATIVTGRRIWAINLPRLKPGRLIGGVRLKYQVAGGNKALRRFLEYLWDEAIEPVLNKLGYLQAQPGSNLPRVWWVTFGLMGLLPLHAAGYHTDRFTTENTISHVISSYTSTFKALEHSLKKDASLPLRNIKPKILLATMPNTTKQQPLDTKTESEAIKDCFSYQEMTYLKSPSADKVCKELPKHEFVHFACHGTSDSMLPSQSGLLLSGDDGEPELLSFSKLEDLDLENANVAFLTACNTAELNIEGGLLDEAIHLANAFQLIGFRHIIGSIMKVNDGAAGLLAKFFYKRLKTQLQHLEGNNNLQLGLPIALLLHESVKDLRDSNYCSVGQVAIWTPFIHFGI